VSRKRSADFGLGSLKRKQRGVETAKQPSPFILVDSHRAWETCLEQLQRSPQLAIDLEANSMFAYRERVCLIQISITGRDFIVDPLAIQKLSGLGELIADPGIEKIFHAAEYDLILLKRDYGWTLHNLFDTMWAARILGYTQVGLASLLEQFYQIKLDKHHQKSNWCQRPLSPAQLAYAYLDTHYLFDLRNRLAGELQARGQAEEAAEIFAEQAQVRMPDSHFDPESFWAISGINDLTPQGKAIARALHLYRNQEAQQRNLPIFKVFGDRTLLEMAQVAPSQAEELAQIYGMTQGQLRRYSQPLLDVIRQSRHDPPPAPPPRSKRPPESVLNRYDKLHTWRKQRARVRGVESDVVASRDALWAIAQANPRTVAELQALHILGPWRLNSYAADILNVLKSR
jgi:ribonuclease D